ncbi:type II toxin-antitoxin system RelE/ParE family toxin [Candidatus Peregrinibacteria bacterium]|nr:type II toxin-antitoxin system RelE/ParE family toxin [Candidatus Peregrinibacteria bacterium]
MRQIVFYRVANGKNPIEEFLDNLPAKDAQKVTWTLKLIEELEVPPKTYFKKLVNTDDVWEVRSRIGNNAYRLLCFQYKNNVVVLTNGFRKKTQKTPRNEMKLAEDRKADWLRRNG